MRWNKVAVIRPLHILPDASSAGAPSVGVLLATRVAHKLEQGHSLHYDHRDYCGPGLTYQAPVYIYAAVWDGQFLSADQIRRYLQSGELASNEDRLFDNREAFIHWLAGQTDASLAGKQLGDAFYHDNQRLTLARLQDFVSDT